MSGKASEQPTGTRTPRPSGSHSLIHRRRERSPSVVLTIRHREGADPDVLDGELRELLERYGRFWRKDVDTEKLRVEVVGLLAAMALATVESDGRVRPHPVAARFAPVVADADDDGKQQSLL